MDDQAWLRTMLAKEYLMDTILGALRECLSQHEKVLLIRFARREIGLGELQSKMISNTQLKIGLAGLENIYQQLTSYPLSSILKETNEKRIRQLGDTDLEETDGEMEKRSKRKRNNPKPKPKRQSYRFEGGVLRKATGGMRRRPGKNLEILEDKQ